MILIHLRRMIGLMRQVKIFYSPPGADPDQILTDAQLKCKAWGKSSWGLGHCKPPSGSRAGSWWGHRGQSPWKLRDFQRFEILRSALLKNSGLTAVIKTCHPLKILNKIFFDPARVRKLCQCHEKFPNPIITQKKI